MTDKGLPQAHWLFKPAKDEPSCLCIVEFEDGDYWVFDSPTGTYAAGHADRGKWRLVEENYLADGYVPEAQAKANGLIPSWPAVPRDSSNEAGDTFAVRPVSPERHRV